MLRRRDAGEGKIEAPWLFVPSERRRRVARVKLDSRLRKPLKGIVEDPRQGVDVAIGIDLEHGLASPVGLATSRAAPESR